MQLRSGITFLVNEKNVYKRNVIKPRCRIVYFLIQIFYR